MNSYKISGTWEILKDKPKIYCDHYLRIIVMKVLKEMAQNKENWKPMSGNACLWKVMRSKKQKIQKYQFYKEYHF